MYWCGETPKDAAQRPTVVWTCLQLHFGFGPHVVYTLWFDLRIVALIVACQAALCHPICEDYRWSDVISDIDPENQVAPWCHNYNLAVRLSGDMSCGFSWAARECRSRSQTSRQGFLFWMNFNYVKALDVEDVITLLRRLRPFDCCDRVLTR